MSETLDLLNTLLDSTDEYYTSRAWHSITAVEQLTPLIKKILNARFELIEKITAMEKRLERAEADAQFHATANAMPVNTGIHHLQDDGDAREWCVVEIDDTDYNYKIVSSHTDIDEAVAWLQSAGG